MKTYFEKLQDPRWQRKRLEVMERDDFCCTICSDSEATLNVHHCYYGKGKNPWEYENCHLITLCAECHRDVESQREDILKVMTWEIPIVSIHALATCGQNSFLSDLASAFRGMDNAKSLRYRAGSIRSAIAFLEGIAIDFETRSQALTKEEQ
jgi:hypothetical protein